MYCIPFSRVSDVVMIYFIANTDASASYSAIKACSCVSKISSENSPSKYPSKNNPIMLQNTANIMDSSVSGPVFLPKIIKSER